MVYENLGLLLLVAITDVVFFGVISRNYRSLDSIQRHQEVYSGGARGKIEMIFYP